MGLEPLGEYNKCQIISQRDAEALVSIGERLPRAGAPIAAALVPCDQLVAGRKNYHFHGDARPSGSREPFGLGDETFAESSRLQIGFDDEHAEMANVVACLFQMYAAEEDAAVLGDQDALIGIAQNFS